MVPTQKISISKFTTIIIAVGLLFLLMPISSAWGCICLPQRSTPAKALYDYDMVFMGKVVADREIVDSPAILEDPSSGRKARPAEIHHEYTILVEKVWKGVKVRKIIIGIDICFYNSLKLGKRQLIYINHFKARSDLPDRLRLPTINGCSRTRFVNSETVETLFLDAAVEGRKVEEILNQLPGIIRNHKNPDVRADAAKWLKRDAPLPLPIGSIPALFAGFKDSAPIVRAAVAETVIADRFNRYKKELRPAIISAFLIEENLLKEAKDPSLHIDVLQNLIGAIFKYGENETKIKTIPHLIRELDNEKYWHDSIKRLESLGPLAKDSLPTLKKILGVESNSLAYPDQIFKLIVAGAIKKIEGK
ncbi:MAG: hypothetical protein ACQ9MH_12365 [Nitrospinales bacterium]